jgi:hypothetical protein
MPVIGDWIHEMEHDGYRTRSATRPDGVTCLASRLRHQQRTLTGAEATLRIFVPKRVPPFATLGGGLMVRFKDAQKNVSKVSRSVSAPCLRRRSCIWIVINAADLPSRLPQRQPVSKVEQWLLPQHVQALRERPHQNSFRELAGVNAGGTRSGPAYGYWKA